MVIWTEFKTTLLPWLIAAAVVALVITENRRTTAQLVEANTQLARAVETQGKALDGVRKLSSSASKRSPCNGVFCVVPDARFDLAFWKKPRIAPRDAHLPQVFTLTHPFHPLHGQTFDPLTYRFNWGEDRVMYLGPNGRTRPLRVGWTDMAPEDSFVAVAAGRAPFRLEDLLALTALLRDIRSSKPERREERRPRVKVIRLFFETYRRTGSMLAIVKEFHT